MDGGDDAAGIEAAGGEDSACREWHAVAAGGEAGSGGEDACWDGGGSWDGDWSVDWGVDGVGRESGQGAWDCRRHAHHVGLNSDCHCCWRSWGCDRNSLGDIWETDENALRSCRASTWSGRRCDQRSRSNISRARSRTDHIADGTAGSGAVSTSAACHALRADIIVDIDIDGFEDLLRISLLDGLCIN